MISTATAMSMATTAALFAAALGSSAGSANYSLAADINGDGKVRPAGRGDPGERLRLPRDDRHGSHHAARTTRSSTSTSTPTPPVGDGMTTDATVTLVGQTDPNVTVTLEPTGATTTSNPNGLFAFFDVPLADGANSFTAIATNAAGRDQSVHEDHHAHPAGAEPDRAGASPLSLPTTRACRHSTTSRPTTSITGNITTVNPIASFEAQLDQSSAVSVLSTLSGTTFTITPALLATINGGPVADGKHTLTLVAKDSNGNLSQPVSVSFILLTTPPAPVTPQLLASSDTGISSSDGITRDTTPTFKVAAPANAIVTLYANGVQVGQATANNGPVFIATTTLAAGTYQITATAEDVAGNVSAPAAPVTLVISTTPPDDADAGAGRRVAEPARPDDPRRTCRS